MLAPPRSFSQLATSFIASMRQGIHQMPLKRLISALLVMHRSQISCYLLASGAGGNIRSLRLSSHKLGRPVGLASASPQNALCRAAKNNPKHHLNKQQIQSIQQLFINSHSKLNTTHGSSGHLEPKHPQLGCIHFLFTISISNAKASNPRQPLARYPVVLSMILQFSLNRRREHPFP